MSILDFVCCAFAGVVIIQVICHVFLFGKFAFIKSTKQIAKTPAVSVIICAKNESENLKSFLPAILSQAYSNFEIVLINDASSDDTLEVMQTFANKHANIKIVDVKSNEAFWGNKKYALTLGIKAAKHDYLLFTDADCKPASRSWISEMCSLFDTEKSIVLGYGGYSKIKNSFLNKLIRFETLVTAIQYFSFAKSGIPYMGVGRNLAYTKKQFFDAKGFMGHMKIKSGDDDLFINEAATQKNTALSFSKNSFTTSTPKKTFKTWITQKRRHVSTAKHYKPVHKYLLSIIYATNLLFWVLAAILLVLNFNWQIVLTLLLLRLVIQYIIYGISAKKLNENDLIIFIPFLEIFLITFQLVIFIRNLISKPEHWK
ncbi:MAG: glycosyltransferase [Algibacter sp.]